VNSKRSLQTVKAPQPREGEGVLVDLIIKATKDLDGGEGQVVTYEADITSAPVPHKRYSADVWSVVFRRNAVKILFAQERHTGDGVRNLLIIDMLPFAVHQFITNADASTFAMKDGKPVMAPESATPIDIEPADTVAFAANFVVAANAGHECCFDFYHASPFSKSAAPKMGKLAIDPIVRVDMRTSMSIGLIEELRRVTSKLPAELLEA